MPRLRATTILAVRHRGGAAIGGVNLTQRWRLFLLEWKEILPSTSFDVRRLDAYQANIIRKVFCPCDLLNLGD